MEVPGDLKQAIVDQAREFVIGEHGVGEDEFHLHLHTDLLPVDSELPMHHTDAKVVAHSDALVVVADLAPEANWGHPVAHLTYDANSAEHLDHVVHTFPIHDFFSNPERFEPLHRPDTTPPDVAGGGDTEAAANVAETLENAAGAKKAILFSGMSNLRHVNDLEFLYRTLIHTYGFSAQDIVVLNWNGKLEYWSQATGTGTSLSLAGKNWPGDNTPYQLKVDHAGTSSDLYWTVMLGAFGTSLGANDTLLIHTNNHGGYADASKSFLCCYPSWGNMWASTFAQAVSKLAPCENLIVMMEQCNSGGFKDGVLASSKATNTSFASAVPDNLSSWGTTYAGGAYDGFALSWTAGLNGKWPNGAAATGPATKDMASVFTWGEANDPAPKDAPVYGDQPSGAGGKQLL